jgi:transposase-like protein
MALNRACIDQVVLLRFDETVMRKLTKTRGSFPTGDAAIKLLYLAIRNAARNWSFIQGWREALNRFHILWPERMPAVERV